LPLGTEQEVTGDPAGVMVERSESEKRRPNGEARYEPTRRVTFRAGAPQRAIEAGRGGDMMRRPSRPPNAPVRRTADSMSSGRRGCSGRQVAVMQSGPIRRVAVLPRLPEPLLPPRPEQRHPHRSAATRSHRKLPGSTPGRNTNGSPARERRPWGFLPQGLQGERRRDVRRQDANCSETSSRSRCSISPPQTERGCERLVRYGWCRVPSRARIGAGSA
jgi:hypothetical protein